MVLILETLHLVFASFLGGSDRPTQTFQSSQYPSPLMPSLKIKPSRTPWLQRNQQESIEELIAVCCWVSVPPLVHLACEKTKHHAMLLGNQKPVTSESTPNCCFSMLQHVSLQNCSTYSTGKKTIKLNRILNVITILENTISHLQASHEWWKMGAQQYPVFRISCFSALENLKTSGLPITELTANWIPWRFPISRNLILGLQVTVFWWQIIITTGFWSIPFSDKPKSYTLW